MDPRRRPPIRALGPVLVATALLAGCGGGDDAYTEADRVELCDAVTALEDEIRAQSTSFQDPDTDDAAARAGLGEVLEAVRRVLDGLPPELEDDAEAVSEDLEEIEARIEDAEVEELRTQLPGEMAAIFSSGEDEEATPASRILEHTKAQCA